MSLPALVLAAWFLADASFCPHGHWSNWDGDAHSCLCSALWVCVELVMAMPGGVPQDPDFQVHS
eukprot:scaffold625_cov324-Pavlova_lutheri.AAC.75